MLFHSPSIYLLQNHGIPDKMINGIHDAAERFFALPDKQKMDLYIGNSQVCNNSSSHIKNTKLELIRLEIPWLQPFRGRENNRYR